MTWKTIKRALFAGWMGAGLALAGIALPTAAASATTVYHPVIKAISVKKSVLPHTGGTFTLESTFKGPFPFKASSKSQFCRLQIVAAPVKATILDVPPVKNCLSHVVFYVHVAANASSIERVDTFKLAVSHAHQWANSIFQVGVEGAPAGHIAPVVTTTTATTSGPVSNPAPVVTTPTVQSTTPTTSAPAPTTTSTVAPTTTTTALSTTTTTPAPTTTTVVKTTCSISLRLTVWGDNDGGYTVTVSGARGVPTGTVTWALQPGNRSVTSTLVNGSANVPSSSSDTSVTISYSGDGSYYPAASGTYTVN